MGRWDKMEKAARRQRHALIVTDTRMHAIRMGSAGFKSLKEPLFSLPREQVELVRDGSNLVFNTVDRSTIWSFTASAFGHNFDGVAAAMADRRPPGA